MTKGLRSRLEADSHKEIFLDASIAALFSLISALACLVTFGAGVLDGSTAISTHDSRGIFAVGNYLISDGDPDYADMALRGYLLPGLNTFLWTLHPLILLCAQAAMIGAGIFCLLRIERHLTGRVLLTPLAVFSISLLIGPAHLLSEPMSFALTSLAMFLIISRETRPFALPVLVAATLARAAYLPALLIMAPFLLRKSRKGLMAALASIVLLMPQVVINLHQQTGPYWPSAGSENLTNRFYPAVVGMSEARQIHFYNTQEAEAARAARPDVKSDVIYILTHPVSALKAWGKILIDYHLTAPTGYVEKKDHPLMSKLSEVLNLVFVGGMLLAIYGVIANLKSMKKWDFALLTPPVLNIVAAPLVYWQGDRIIYPALIMLLPFAGLGLRTLVPPRKAQIPTNLKAP